MRPLSIYNLIYLYGFGLILNLVCGLCLVESCLKNLFGFIKFA